MKDIKKYFNITNILLVVFVIISTTFAILYSSLLTWIIWISGITGILSACYGSKGKWICFVFDIISYGTYIYICLVERYYGELILAGIVIIIYTVSLFEWRRNNAGDHVKINALSLKELLLTFSIGIISIVVYAVALYYMKSDLPILNAIPTVAFLLGTYFSFRRSPIQFCMYVMYELLFISLWIIAAVSGDTGGIIFVIEAIGELVFCSMGIYKWTKKLKQQNASTSPDSTALEAPASVDNTTSES